MGLQFYPSLVVKTIDLHVGGQPLRFIVDGMASPRGATMHERQQWASRHADRARRMAIFEPRGHADLSGAVLTEPVAPGSHAGVLFMNGDGYMPMSVHGVIGVVTAAFQHGLIDPGGDGRHLALDTVAGTVRVDVEMTPGDDGRSIAVTRVSVASVPSFVSRAGVELVVANRRLRADIAYGGRFYAIVDSESAGVSLDRASEPELRRMGRAIARAAEDAGAPVHPVDARIGGVHGTIFTSPSHEGTADMRTVAVHAGGGIDRSAGGTGMSAVMAVLDAMGFLSETPFVAESVIGTTLRAWCKGRTTVGEHDAILPVIEGRGWIVGESTWIASAGDRELQD
jgi:proline racemase